LENWRAENEALYNDYQKYGITRCSEGKSLFHKSQISTALRINGVKLRGLHQVFHLRMKSKMINLRRAWKNELFGQVNGLIKALISFVSANSNSN
jgi:hypothetical protein